MINWGFFKRLERKQSPKERKQPIEEGKPQITVEENAVRIQSGPFFAVFLYMLGCLGRSHAEEIRNRVELAPSKYYLASQSIQSGVDRQIAQFKLDLEKIKVEDVAKIGAIVETVKDLINISKEDKKLAQQSYELTQNLNNVKEIIDFFKEKGSFSIKDIQIQTDYYNSDLPSNKLEQLTRHIVSWYLSQSFNIKEVGSLKEIKETSKERRELRENPEVKQEKVPPPGTLEPFRYNINVKVLITTKFEDKSKEIETLLGKNWRNYLEIFMRVKKTIVRSIFVIEALDIHNNNKISIIAFGTPTEVEKMQQEIAKIYWRFKFDNLKMSEDSFRVVLALLSSINNLHQILNSKNQPKGEDNETGDKGKKSEIPVFLVSSFDYQQS